MMKLNPYIAGNPVGGGEAFIGRSSAFKSVLRVLKNPSENGIVLFGQRRIGKTSVLMELAKILPNKGPFAPIYFDLQDKAALPLDKVLRELANKILYDLDISPFEKVEDDFENVFKNEFLAHVLNELPENGTLTFLFDEFDVLDNPKSEQAGSALFPYLRDLMSSDTRRIKFLFVIGRRPEDLTNLSLSLFKGVKSHHVSLLSQEDTTALIQLSGQNDSLKWPDDVVVKVKKLTGGHPFLTQQLCQEIWEIIYDDDPAEPPVVQIENVDRAVPEALKRATNSLEWLWDGLGPAERVVASALAEAGPHVISTEELEKLLQESGVRILIGELQDAPRVLEAWDLIQSEKKGFRFRVEIMRQWIAQRKPLARVQDEIDRILPVADNLFQAAYGLYQGGQLKEAIPLLQQTVALNPNHFKANQLLAEILLAQGDVNEALKLLEILYEFNPNAARPRLIQTLLIQAKEEKNVDKKLNLFERILNLDPIQPEVEMEFHNLWIKKGEIAYKNDVFDEALHAFKKANSKEKIEKVKKRLHIENLYQQALSVIDQKPEKAAFLLADVIAFEPFFKESSRYLYLAVAGEDPEKLEEKNIDSQRRIQKLIEESSHNQKTIQTLLKSKDDFKKHIKKADKGTLELKKTIKDLDVGNINLKKEHSELKASIRNLAVNNEKLIEENDKIKYKLRRRLDISKGVFIVAAFLVIALSVTSLDFFFGLSRLEMKITSLVNQNFILEEKVRLQRRKHALRAEPITVTDEDAQKIFKLDKGHRPLVYIDNDFEDNGDDTITDHTTGLIWQKSGSKESLSYQDAMINLVLLNNINFAGYKDWRLPTVEETMSIIRNVKQSNALFINPIFEYKQSYCWTSDVHSPDSAWTAFFYSGSISRSSKQLKLFVRAVR